jgi:2-polyprenyl-3-methyl-5-hydroxy-6-metoxy-1,4-benzoquinol methylase
MTADRPQCPACSSANGTSISPDLYLCTSCQIAYNTGYRQKIYDDNYFLDEYRAQYGKTYIEDHDAIYAASRKRLARLLSYIRIKKSLSAFSLLDIGSAAGFFLQCARDSGIQNVSGIEISEYASRYCREHFQIPVIRSSFADIALTEKHDIITAWFFIEHCNDPVPVLQKIYGALAEGGIFAFSAPSIFGPLFIFDRSSWINAHPTDHRVDFSPAGARKILKKIGYRKIIIRAAGMHPERVVSPDSLFYKPFTLLYKLFAGLTSFSDTIEVYAVK